jgi:hypothetical protein
MTTTLLLNPLTGTYHAHDQCKGLRDSQAQLQPREVRYADLPRLKKCGFCLPTK